MVNVCKSCRLQYVYKITVNNNNGGNLISQVAISIQFKKLFLSQRGGKILPQ